MPEFLEPYQSVNTDGATVRRYALVNPDNQVQIDSQAMKAPQRASAKVERQQQQLQTAQASVCQPASGIIKAAASQDSIPTATSRKLTSNASAGIQLHTHLPVPRLLPVQAGYQLMTSLLASSLL